MIVKRISYYELKEAIRVAFLHDKEIYSLYDPNISVTNIDELVEDVFRKIQEYEGVTLSAVYENDILIGYFVNVKDQLVSFGLAVKYRVRKYLIAFFDLIKQELGGSFHVYLWNKNTRAIGWLSINGMVATYCDNQIIKLQCQ